MILKHLEEEGGTIILGGDFNACLHDGLRRNYSRGVQGLHPDIRRADQLYKESVAF